MADTEKVTEDVFEDELKDDQEDKKDTVKVHRITRKDLDKVAAKLKEELEERKNSDFRKNHEAIWKEVDRQINMQPMLAVNRDTSEPTGDWHSVVELGELSKASENISADVLRIVFPAARNWFDAHSDLTPMVPAIDTQPEQWRKLQGAVDGRVRAMMLQQHIDFGLKQRCELSLKEALHHGAYVAEIRWETQEMIFGGTKVKLRGAPVWVPHSMWNCYPDSSPAVIGANIFYDGSLFIESYLKRHLAEELVKSKEEGWFASQWSKVSKDVHVIKKGDSEQKVKDVKIVTYWGDIVIPREDGDLLYPNHKCVLMNGTIVYLNPNPTPYPPIIYRGYERNDVRDPYYMSPIIKQSPLQKVASVLTNQALDGIALQLEPPIIYDGNDPDFVLNGGPEIKPGAKVSSKGSNAFQQVKIGDPAIAIQGLELCLREIKEKLGRPGAPVGDRATRAEVVKSEQDQEASLTGFITKFEDSLRSFLYMQHAMNLDRLTEYEFYSAEMRDPDFIRITKKELPKDVVFEVVGARGVLGEQERTQRMSVVTAFAAGNPLFAPLLNAEAILMQMYQDAGVKNADRFIAQQGQMPAAQAQAALQQAQQTIQKLGGLLQQEKQKSAVKMAKIQADTQAKSAKLQSDHAMKQMKIMADYDAKLKAMEINLKTDVMKMIQDRAIEFERQFERMTQNKLTKGLENASVQ